MKIHVISDVHVDRFPPAPLPADLVADVVVVAGDISEDVKRGAAWLRDLSKRFPVVAVLGNHDFYGNETYESRVKGYKAAVRGSRVRILENESTVLKIGNSRVRFLGCTLWTNFGEGNPQLMRIAHRLMRDYQQIRVPDIVDKMSDHEKAQHESLISQFSWRGNPAVSPAAFKWLHETSAAFLWDNLRKKQGNWDRTVVVTHHWPTWDGFEINNHILPIRDITQHGKMLASASRPGLDDGLYILAAYGSDVKHLVDLAGKHADVWICGHFHWFADFVERGLRIVCNPRGGAAPFGNRDMPWLYRPNFCVDLDNNHLTASLDAVWMKFGHAEAVDRWKSARELGSLLYDTEGMYSGQLREVFMKLCADLLDVARTFINYSEGHVKMGREGCVPETHVAKQIAMIIERMVFRFADDETSRKMKWKADRPLLDDLLLKE